MVWFPSPAHCLVPVCTNIRVIRMCLCGTPNVLFTCVSKSSGEHCPCVRQVSSASWSQTPTRGPRPTSGYASHRSGSRTVALIHPTRPHRQSAARCCFSCDALNIHTSHSDPPSVAGSTHTHTLLHSVSVQSSVLRLDCEARPPCV